MSYVNFYTQYLYVSTDQPNNDGEVYGLCPFHDDSDPSFSFNDVTGLWYCFKCKEGDDAAGFLMKLEGIPYAEAERRVAEALGNPTLPSNEEITEWENRLWNSAPVTAYLERRGLTDKELLKEFRLGFDGERLIIPIYDKDGVLKNVRRLRLPGGSGDKALNWRGFGKATLWPEKNFVADTIVLCAGEIDCLSAIQQGHNAVTGTGGETVWVQDWSDKFRDKVVYIAYDGDETGRRMGKQIAKELQGFAREVRVLDLPDGEDVNSLHQQGIAIQEYIDKAKDVILGPRLLTGEELQREAELEAKRPWIVEGLLRPGWLAILSGHAKRGKTTLLSHLMVSIQAGEPFLGKTTTKVPTIYLNYEMPTQGLAEMLDSVSGGRPDIWPLVMLDPPTPLTPEALLPYLKGDSGLVIIDSAIGAFMFRGDEENSSGEVGYNLRGLLSLARSTGWSFMIIHHLSKHGNSPAGSREWLAAPDVIWMWNKRKGSDHGIFSIEGRIPPLDDQRVRLSYNECVLLGSDIKDAEDQEKLEAIRRYLRGFPGETTSKIAEDTGIPRATVHRLLMNNNFRRVGTGSSRHDPFRWYVDDEGGEE